VKNVSENGLALEKEEKRLFFGAEVRAAWPPDLPLGRMIPEETRHVTLAYLGQSAIGSLLPLLPHLPHPAFRVAPAGLGSELLFLPKKHARVVALAITWLENPQDFFSFQEKLSSWFEKEGFSLKRGAFTPHITVARAPFEKEKWQERFEPLPFFLAGFHLYESLGNLTYHSLWSYPLTAPFIEREHTADIAFEICGESMKQLFSNAQLALFFKFPPLAQYYTPASLDTVEAIVIELNRMIAFCDEERGCPFKAVSFHGDVSLLNNLYFWEMIVDV
jgi:RNA 2',3'-cyclic 3'-phosphodiesterase